MRRHFFDWSLCLLSFLTVALAGFVLPATTCLPDAAINTCCAQHQCSMSHMGKCCEPSHQDQTLSDLLVSPRSESVGINTLLPTMPVRTLGACIASVKFGQEQSFVFSSLKASELKPHKIYLLNRSLLI